MNSVSGSAAKSINSDKYTHAGNAKSFLFHDNDIAAGVYIASNIHFLIIFSYKSKHKHVSYTNSISTVFLSPSSSSIPPVYFAWP